MTEPPSILATVNATTGASSSSFQMEKGAVLAAAIVEILIIIVGTVGNLFTIIAVLRNRHLQYATNYLIVSLAVADFLVSTILVPMRATQHISYQNGGTVPKAFVEVAGFVGRVNIIASISTLVCLSVDRCLALSKPLRYATSIRYSLGKVSVAIATVWILAVLITSLPKFPVVTDEPFLIFFVVFVLTATLIICVMYYRIYRIVSQSLRGKTKGEPVRYSNNFQKGATRKVRVVDEREGSEKSTANASTESVATSSESRGIQFSKEERKAAKTVGLVIVAFIVLVYPRIIMILFHFGEDETSSSKVARFWVRVLLYTNSAVNPLFYAYRHKGFQKEFKKMGLKCLGLGERLRQRYTTMRRTDPSSSSAPTFYA